MAVQQKNSTEQHQRSTPRQVALDVALFDARMLLRGVRGVAAQARTFGMDRSHLHKIRNGQFVPNMRKAREMADYCGVSTDELFPAVERDAA